MSRQNASSSGRPNLADVLVDDRELAPKDPDRFRHEDIVEQLADLSVQVTPPANIALYGPWGSGKSSIASHLEAELERRNAPVRFVRYDAFKFAQLPLQRHFIRHVASMLSIKDTKYGKGLYEETTTNDLILGSSEEGRTKQLLALLAQTVIILSVALGAAVVLTACAAALGAWTSEDDSFGSNFSDYLRTNTIGFLAPAGLLAVFGALAGKKLSVTRGRSAPTSEEQFASTFSDLVADALKPGIWRRKCDRLVIFIDELDRCDGRTVVATLDSLRSFLDAQRCVFIVAADQQVLETALTSHVRQATPSDPANPYYSAGSEYLDKTFHYQLPIPPLLPRRLSGFAADLVRDKGGVWSDVPSVDRVVSVLIPNHVRSPRRAKTLLNAFALLYELARRRCEVGHLAGDPIRRAEEIAVLACLRVEFPLFARDLRQHPRLVEAARAVLTDASHRPKRIPEATWKVASDFVHGERPVDVLLADGAAADAEPSDGGDPDERPTPLREAQSHQLQAYLRKTGYVNGPDRDLIHLESSGARFGLDPADAEELEDAASQADTATVDAVLDRLGDQRYQGMLSLAESLDRDVPPLGHEADNLVTVVLRLYAAVRSEDGWAENVHGEEIRGRFTTAINAHARTYELRADDLPGALALGLDSRGNTGEALVATVLAHDASPGHGPLTLLAVGAYGALRATHADEVVALVGRGLTDASLLRAIADAIRELPADLAIDLVEGVEPQLTRHLAAVLAAANEEAEREDEADPADEEEHEEVDPETAVKAAASEWLDAFAGSPALIQRLAHAVLGVDHAGARHAVESYLPDLVDASGLVLYAALAQDLVAGAQVRVLQSVPRWLAPVNPSDLPDELRTRAADRLADKGWKTLDKDNEDAPGYLPEFLQAVARLLVDPLDEASALSSAITASLATPASDVQAAAELIRLARLRAFTEAGVLANATAGSAVTSPFESALASAIQPPNAEDGTLQRWTTAAADFVAAHAAAADAQGCVAALKASPWFLGTERLNAELRIATGAAARGEEVASPYSAEEVTALVLEHGAGLDDVAARWLRWFPPTAAAGYAVLDALFMRRPSTDGAADIRGYVAAVEVADRLVLVEPEIRRCVRADPRTDLLRALGVADMDEAAVTHLIIETFATASNMDHRRRLLELWSEAQVQTSTNRARLIHEVLVPTANAGIGGLDLVIKHVDLWRDPPHGTKGVLRDLRKLADGDQKDRLVKALIHAELLREEKTWFGLGPSNFKDVD